MTSAFPLPVPIPASSATATTAAGQQALETFLMGRGLDPEVAARYGLKESNGRIEIPYLRDGIIRNRKFRGLSEKTFSQDGGAQFLWNIDVLSDESLASEPIIITEGEFDALAAIQSGYLRTVSVPNGAPAQRDTASLKYLDEVEEILRKETVIILAVDDDEAGSNLLHDLSIRLGKSRCKWLKYPKGCKDLGDALRLFGVRGVQATIQRASYVSVRGLYAMSELPPVPPRRIFSVGIPGFDKYMRLRLGDFSVVTGTPGHGKTTFVNDILCRILTNYRGLKVAIASFEQSPQSDHRRNLRTWHAGKLEVRMSEEEIAAADAFIDEKFVFIVPDDDDDVTLDWVLERAATAAIRHGVKIVVLDPWNEMDHERPKDMSLTEYTGFAIKQFKKFARKYQVHLMVVAHPAKMHRSKDGKYPIPTLYDISDSAHWYNKPDYGFVVHRDTDGSSSVIIAKSRYQDQLGELGIIDVAFSRETGRFSVVDNAVIAGDDKGRGDGKKW